MMTSVLDTPTIDPSPSGTNTDAMAAGNRWLLVSDIDDTFLGDSTAAERLIKRLTRTPDLFVVFNSSRPFESVQKTLAQLPGTWRPDGLITALGTEVFLKGRIVENWPVRFGDWARAAIDEVMAELGARPHAAEFQTPFKASYAVERRYATLAREKLAELPFAIRVIASGASDFDVIPANAGKGEATLAVASMLDVDPAARLVVAGDSGNDLDMFAVSQMGIVVGNARDELRTEVDPGRAYFASGCQAEGISEGLRQWGAPLRGD